jgi:hypothetical protein
LIVAIVLSLADEVGASNWPHSMNDNICQLANSFAGPYCFVIAGTAVAPSNKIYSAVSLALISALLTVGVIILGSISDTGHSVRWLTITGIIGLIGVAAACLRVHAAESV